MDYNTDRPALIIAEYGRNIQNMIDYAVTVKDRAERSRIAAAIVNVMSILNPQTRDLADAKIKLWDHLFIMSNFKLDCDSPYPKPDKEKIHPKPKKVPYPTYNVKYKHYGNSVLKVIEEAKKLSEGPAKDHLVILIANYMKQSYVNYNRDNVNDEVIFEQLKKISGGELIVKEDARLKEVAEPKPQSNEFKRNRNKNRKNKNGRRK